MGKNKYKDEFDVNNQQEFLNKLNDAMLTGEPLSIDVDSETAFTSKITSSIEQMLEARDDLADNEEIASEYASNLMKRAYGESFVKSASKSPKTNDSQKNAIVRFTGIRITRGVGEFNTVIFSDGVRSLTIDLNTLSEDEKTLPYDGDGGAYVVSFIRLEEVLTNFYPTAVFTRSEADISFGKICEYNSNRFHFYEYPDFTRNLILAYYIDDKSVSRYIDIVHEVYDTGHIISFLNALKNLSEQEGFTYKNCTDTFSKQMMLLERYRQNKEDFKSEFFEDDDTEIDTESPAESAYESLAILPFDCENPYTDELLGSSVELDQDNSSDDGHTEWSDDEQESREDSYEDVVDENEKELDNEEIPVSDGRDDGAEKELSPEETVNPDEFFLEEDNPRGYPAKKAAKKKENEREQSYIIKRI